jgi:hypothetical protein
MQVPTPLQQDGRTIATVNHYSEIHALPARNRLFAFK